MPAHCQKNPWIDSCICFQRQKTEHLYHIYNSVKNFSNFENLNFSSYGKSLHCCQIWVPCTLVSQNRINLKQCNMRTVKSLENLYMRACSFLFLYNIKQLRISFIPLYVFPQFHQNLSKYWRTTLMGQYREIRRYFNSWILTFKRKKETSLSHIHPN